MIEKPHGPIAFYTEQPTHSVMEAEQLHRPDLFLVRIAKGTSGRQKSWSWAIICWRPAGYEQRSRAGWQLVAKCTSASHTVGGRFKWWMISVRSHIQFYDYVRGETYREAQARSDMIYMAKEMFP